MRGSCTARTSSRGWAGCCATSFGRNSSESFCNPDPDVVLKNAAIAPMAFRNGTNKTSTDEQKCPEKCCCRTAAVSYGVQAAQKIMVRKGKDPGTFQ